MTLLAAHRGVDSTGLVNVQHNLQLRPGATAAIAGTETDKIGRFMQLLDASFPFVASQCTGLD